MINALAGPGPLPLQPSNESTREFLVRRARELNQQIDGLRGQLAPKEQELAEVQKAMQALGIGASEGIANLSPLGTSALGIGAGVTNPLALARSALGVGSSENLTIKQMIMRALRDHFKDAGATPADFRTYIRTVYGRDVDRTSISPQLTRLREQGAIQQREDDRWELTGAGAMYDHPTSWE